MQDLSNLPYRFIIIRTLLNPISSLLIFRGPNITLMIVGQLSIGVGNSLTNLSQSLVAEGVPKVSRSIVLGLLTGIVSLIVSGGQITEGAFQKYEVMLFGGNSIQDGEWVSSLNCVFKPSLSS